MNDNTEHKDHIDSPNPTQEKAHAALQSMRQKAASKGFMTDEEIDAEIQAARNGDESCSNLSAISGSLSGLVPDTLTREELREERLKEKYGL